MFIHNYTNVCNLLDAPRKAFIFNLRCLFLFYYTSYFLKGLKLVELSFIGKLIHMTINRFLQKLYTIKSAWTDKYLYLEDDRLVAIGNAEVITYSNGKNLIKISKIRMAFLSLNGCPVDDRLLKWKYFRSMNFGVYSDLQALFGIRKENASVFYIGNRLLFSILIYFYRFQTKAM